LPQEYRHDRPQQNGSEKGFVDPWGSVDDDLLTVSDKKRSDAGSLPQKITAASRRYLLRASEVTETNDDVVRSLLSSHEPRERELGPDSQFVSRIGMRLR
jgi:hypothetical protein